jgi:hypothetical protein
LRWGGEEGDGAAWGGWVGAAREKGCDQHRRTVRDWHHQRVQSCQRELEWVPGFLNGGCVALDGTRPAGTGRILPPRISV